MKAIFIHGGPGLSSNPEKKILGPEFEKYGFEPIFWNEPKEFSTENYYQEILESIISLVHAQEEKIILIGHSSGCKNILNVLPKIKEKVQSICFLSPALDFDEADKNIIKFALTLFKENDKESADKLQSLVPLLNDNFDDNKTQAVLLGFSSGYFLHNFSTPQSFENYFQYLQGENEFRVNDYIKVRKTIPLGITDSIEVFDIPLLALYGEKDPIFDYNYGKSIIEMFFNNAKTLEIPNVSHCPHIDSTKLFFEKLQSL